MEGGYGGHCEFTRGCPPDVYGCSRRGGLGPVPRRPGNGHHSTARPVPSPPSRVSHLVAAGMTGGWRQGKGQQQPAPLAPPLALTANYPWWLGLTGLTNKEGRLEDGVTHSCKP